MSISGIIVADKPAGWTSHDVVAKLRGILQEKRIGHGGTLDPIATGVLPVFIGNATRATQFCENANKEYIAGLRLGISTDTQDITGNTIGECDVSVSAADLLSVIPRFLGAQKQIPPMYSAVKQNGRKLYELARRGLDVSRPPRDIHISDIELLENNDNEYLLRIGCSKGTYIRTLCHDLGQALGCGGTMSSLRRTKAGMFDLGMAHSLVVIQDAANSGSVNNIMLKVDSVFSEYPSARLGEPEVLRCRNGAPCSAPNLANGKYRFYGPDDEFLLFGKVVNGKIERIKGFY